MYIRGYSSPFSWINIDLETALYFIHKNCKNCLNSKLKIEKYPISHEQIQIRIKN
jgi:hypothetical protein